MKEFYLTENVRSLDAEDTVDGIEVTRDETNDNEVIEEDSEEITNLKKKRGRVKIKISRNNSRGKICDIIDSKNDLVDKTPSPFAARQTKQEDKSPRDETPKKSSFSKSVKIQKVEQKTDSMTSTCINGEKSYSGDENDNVRSQSHAQKTESSVNLSADDNVASGNSVNSLTEIASREDAERKRFNAFQVLMERKKPLRYKSVSPMSRQEKESTANATAETKEKLKRNKEKLISLANKKGYEKRKHAEMEEAEEIEARLDKRIKVFKQLGTKKSKINKITGLSNAVSPGNLHNYFSPVSAEITDSDLDVSGVPLESQVPVVDSSNTVDETGTNIPNSFSTPDTITTVENSDLPTPNGKQHSGGMEKRRWSLRINLRSNKHDNKAESIIEDAENVEEGNISSKLRRVKEKIKIYEEKNNSHVSGSSIKAMKKKKTSGKVKSSKNVSKTQTDTSDVQNRVSEDVIIPIDEKTEQQPDIVIIEEKNPNKVEKLAPLFVKREKLDPAVLEARRAFLQSAPPSNDDRRVERKVPVEPLGFLPFPTVTHVTQLSSGENIEHPKNHESIFSMKEVSRPFVKKYDLKEFRCVTNLDEKPIKNIIEDKPTKPNVEEILNETESRCPDARNIWSIISSKLKNQEKTIESPIGRGRKKKSVDKDDSLTKNESNENRTWTEKYRPMSTRDVVGNEEAAEKFSKWLKGWRTDPERNGDSSGDEFYSSDCSYAESNEVAVLLGPHGSGKTASVYAIAEELGYSVLEINASSKRAGKRILKELEEATKSHRIKRQDFVPLQTTTRDNVKAVSKNSLILVEDVDLIFQEDEGFISAMWQLASNTKRPIVMTGRTACSHLNKMAPQQHRIYYQNAFGSRVSALLELITFAESGYRLPRPCLDRLLRNGDLRRALLQLQYLLISGNPNVSAVPVSFHQSLWQDMRSCVYKPAIRGAKKSRKKKRINLDESSSSKNENSIIDSLANDLDRLSFLSTMIEIDDPAIEISSLKLEPSLSLDENIHDYSSARETNHEIATWLRNRLMKEVASNDFTSNDLHNYQQLSLKKELRAGVDLALSQISPQILDRRSMMLDYLPSVRTICRAEHARTLKNNKRGNRFFHYLQNLRLPALSTRPNILAAACKMMQEDDPEMKT